MAGLRKCKNCQIGGSYCVMTNAVPRESENGFKYYQIELYKRGRLDDNGTAPILVGPGYTCRIGQQDHYNQQFITESQSGFEGPAVFEPSSTEPIVFAQRRNNWESLSTHLVTGDEYQTRNWEELHPFYHMVYTNDPINKTGLVSPTEIVEVVGHENFMLVSDKWTSDMYNEPRKAIGIPRVRYCIGMYGSINRQNHVIEHISMKDNVTEVDWFENFTKMGYKPKKMNVHIASDAVLINHFKNAGVNDKKVLSRLIRAFDMIRHGAYINLYKLLQPYGIDQKTIINATTKTLSTKNPKQLYMTSAGKRYNMDKLLQLYKNLIDGNLCQPSEADALAAYKAGTLDELRARYEQYRARYLSNIINYVLNDPELKASKPDSIHTKLAPAYRYWNAIEIVVSGIRLGLITKERVPLWFKEMVYQHQNLIGDPKRMARIEGPEENFIAPAVTTVKKYLVVKPEQETAYTAFKPLLRHIKRTTPLELESCWEHFLKAHVLDEPSLFWRYIENLTELNDVHDILHLNSKEDAGFNMANKLYDAMISSDSFDVFEPNRAPDSDLVFPGRSSNAMPTVENYDAVYNRSYLELAAIKLRDAEPEMATEIDDLDDMTEPGYVDDHDDPSSEEGYIEDALAYSPEDEEEINSPGMSEHLSEDMEFILSDPFDEHGKPKWEQENGNTRNSSEGNQDWERDDSDIG